MAGPFKKAQLQRKQGVADPSSRGRIVLVRPTARPASSKPRDDETAWVTKLRPPIQRKEITTGDVIGIGGFSVVYEATYPSLHDDSESSPVCPTVDCGDGANPTASHVNTEVDCDAAEAATATAAARSDGFASDCNRWAVAQRRKRYAYKECCKGLFPTEVWFMATLESHRNINQGRFVFKDDAIAGLLLDRCRATLKEAVAWHSSAPGLRSLPSIDLEGLTGLDKRLRTSIQCSPLPLNVIKCIVPQVIRGLVAMHANRDQTFRLADGSTHRLASGGFIHNDLKPENIMICDDGVVQICDFGLVSARHAPDTEHDAATCVACLAKQHNRPYCTAAYQPPEGWGLATGDIWCLGLTVLELATGIPALVDAHENLNDIVNSSLRPLDWTLMADHVRTLGLEVYDEVAEFCAFCLKNDPAERYSLNDLLLKASLCDTGSMNEQDVLSAWMQDLHVSTPNTPVQRTPSLPRVLSCHSH